MLPCRIGFVNCNDYNYLLGCDLIHDSISLFQGKQRLRPPLWCPGQQSHMNGGKNNFIFSVQDVSYMMPINIVGCDLSYCLD